MDLVIDGALALTACAGAAGIIATGVERAIGKQEDEEAEGCMSVTVVFFRLQGGGEVAVSGWVGSSASSEIVCHF